MCGTRKGGSTSETNIESSKRTRLATEPCSTLRLCDIWHLLQNYHKPDFLDDSETEILKFGHHIAKLVHSNVPGVRLHDDRVGILQGVAFMANQIVLQALDVTYLNESFESPVWIYLTNFIGK